MDSSIQSKKSLENLRYILSGRAKELEEELGNWRELMGSADCDAHPDCPLCVMETEQDLLKRHLACIDRELWYLESKS